MLRESSLFADYEIEVAYLLPKHVQVLNEVHDRKFVYYYKSVEFIIRGTDSRNYIQRFYVSQKYDYILKL